MWVGLCIAFVVLRMYVCATSARILHSTVMQRFFLHADATAACRGRKDNKHTVMIETSSSLFQTQCLRSDLCHRYTSGQWFRKSDLLISRLSVEV